MILAVLQARMGSVRLPGKVMKPILGTPMLFLEIERIRRARLLDALVVATTVDVSDDMLADECVRRDVAVYRGSVSDVLDRYVKAARDLKPVAVVRLTGDCPLIDWTVIDRVVQTYLDGNFEYVANVDPPTYPDGLDVEIIDLAALHVVEAEARLASEREHVTTYIRKYPGRFRAANVRSPVDLSAMRWTVDNPEDFELVRAIYEALYPSNPAFETKDVLAFLKEHPELLRLNQHMVRNAGLLKSLEADKRSFGL
jgi:spore coat polysaccharide biosynthesis protein SpsF (cytidylyltransferase family)